MRSANWRAQRRRISATARQAVFQQPRAIGLGNQSAKVYLIPRQFRVSRNGRLTAAAKTCRESALRVHHFARGRSSSARRIPPCAESFCRHSMPITPWVTAGRQIFGSSRAVMRDSWPKRIRPAHARTMASMRLPLAAIRGHTADSCPASSLRRRVSTLPRSDSIRKSGRNALVSEPDAAGSKCPPRAPCGRSSRPCDTRRRHQSIPGIRAFQHRTDGQTHEEDPPARLSSNAQRCRRAVSSSATSSSLMNKPLPPMAANVRS